MISAQALDERLGGPVALKILAPVLAAETTPDHGRT